MYLCGYDVSVAPYLLQYCVSIGSQNANASYGIFGNAWMVGWLFQQNSDSLELKMSRVNSCADVQYSGSSSPLSPSPPSPPSKLSSRQRDIYVAFIAGFNAALGGFWPSQACSSTVYSQGSHNQVRVNRFLRQSRIHCLLRQSRIHCLLRPHKIMLMPNQRNQRCRKS